MQTKTQLIYNDVLTMGLLGVVLFDKHSASMSWFWIILFAYYLIKQAWAHRNNYKLNNRLF